MQLTGTAYILLHLESIYMAKRNLASSLILILSSQCSGRHVLKEQCPRTEWDILIKICGKPSEAAGCILLLKRCYRPHSKANRAGTRGFRAPEVLLKCNEQTGGTCVCIKIFAVTILIRRYSNRHLVCRHDSPFFLDSKVPSLPIKRRYRGSHGNCIYYWQKAHGKRCNFT